MLAPTCNEEFELPYGLCFVSDIQDYSQYVIKRHETVTNNPPIKLCENKIENRIIFQIETGYHLKIVTPETRKLFGSTKSKIFKHENRENIPHLEITEFTEIVLVHYITVNSYYQRDSRVLCRFAPNKLSGQLLDISPKYFIFSKTFNSEF